MTECTNAPIAIPTGWSVADVHIYTGCGHWKYPLMKAISEGHIIPVNVSTHRYEVVQKPNQTIRLVLEPTKKGC